MAVGIVYDYAVLFAFEGVEGDMSPPAGPNPVLDIGVSSGSDQESLEPREVLGACDIHAYLYLFTKETYNMFGAVLPKNVFWIYCSAPSGKLF